MKSLLRIAAVTLGATLFVVAAPGVRFDASSLSSAAFAQSRSGSTLNIPQAPVGHRQPTASPTAGPSAPPPPGGDIEGPTAKQKAETERARRITRSICTGC